ncbi:MAG TPA: hypothetical protein VGX68_18320 [Thermoanaerobaculia bacterium]|jgi:hypothetical protein|nr:hypothetical protein [Thermoanaerobaculia bacterium]
MKRAALFAGIVGLIGAAWIANPLPANAAKPDQVNVVDETGGVLFGTGTPGSVQITNFPLALGPANPSDIATVSTHFENVCPDSPSSVLARVFNRLEGSDGSAHIFSIPPGKVLVITGVEIEAYANGIVANHLLDVRLSKNTVNDANIMVATALSDGFGIVRLHYQNPTGTVVKSGVNVCLSARDVTASSPAFAVHGILSGYLADDN